MKIKVQKIQLASLSPSQWLRRAGYALIYDRRSDQESFSRRFSRDFYPRFHLYVQEPPQSDYIFFNLHLDHKRASYEGQSRHSADYDGELVEAEARRLEALLGAAMSQNNNIESDVLSGLKVTTDLSSRPTKKSFWQKLFS